MNNIILIGMAGCGKSSVGVIAAKRLGFDFLDTDLVLQRQEKRLLWQILADDGLDGFYRAEEKALLNVTAARTVIATGGSVVYGRRAMKRLHENGVVVYIRLPYQEIERRLSNLATRGVTLREGQTLHDLYEERIPLYEKEADVVLDAAGLQIDQTVEAIARRMETMNGAGYGI